jgi:hypothetical protein
MKGLIIVLIALVVVATGAAQYGKFLRAKTDIATRVEYNLDFVDENSFDAVRADLIKTAAKSGVELTAADIHIAYEDTDKQLFTQRAVGRVADFQNKQVGIVVRYRWRIFGFDFPQEITRAKIKQIQVQRKALPQEYQDLLE